jgi:NTP pyrophosphatase (non-canonical NTP hydrolase)
MSDTPSSTKPDIATAYNDYISKITDASTEFAKMFSMTDMYKHAYSKYFPKNKTNFEKVAEFNTTAAVERLTEKSTTQVFETHPKMIETCLSLIKEEVSELETAVKERDLTETRDALADILYVVYGMAFRLGINADTDFELVHASNMSKFCTSEEEAQETMRNYESLYAQGKSPYPSPGYRFESDTVCTGIESSAPKGNSTATASILNSKPTPGGRELGVGGTGKWVVFEKSTGKILKNINYKPVDLSM